MEMIRRVLARIGFYLLNVIIGAFFLIPLLWLITAPFNPAGTLRVKIPRPFSLINFVKVFDNSFATHALINSVIQAGGAMVGTVFIAALAAYVLSRVPFRGRDIAIYVLILFSSVVSGTAAMVPIYLLTTALRIVNTQIGVILVLIGGLLPTAIFILRDFVDSLPRSYEESALTSGAKHWQMLRDIVLPLTRPGLAVIGVWAFVNVWGGFLIPFILLSDPQKYPAAVAIYSYSTQFGPVLTLISTYSLLYAVPVIVLYLYVNRRYGFRFFGGIRG